MDSHAHKRTLTVFGLLMAGCVMAASSAPAASRSAEVAAILSVGDFDLILLSSQRGHSIRRGTVLEVVSEGRAIAELLVVESRAEQGAALITSLSGNEPILPGASVRLKIRQSSIFS